MPFNGFGNLGTSSGSGPSDSNNYNVALNSVYTFNPSTILNVSYGFARKVNHSDPFSSGIDLTSLGFPAAVQQAASEQHLEFPRTDIQGNNGVSSLGQSTFTTLRIQAYSHDLRTDLTKVHGSHSFMVGAEERVLFMNFRQHGAPSGSYTFNNGWTQRQVGAASSTTQGAGMASFLLGYVGSGSLEHTMAIASSSQYYGFYVRDDWRVSRKLTLNLGLRWDVDLPRTERYNRLSYWDPECPVADRRQGSGFPNLKGAMMFVDAGSSPPDAHRHEQLGPALRLRLPVRAQDRVARRLWHSVFAVGAPGIRHFGQLGNAGLHRIDEHEHLVRRRRHAGRVAQQPVPERLQPSAGRRPGGPGRRSSASASATASSTIT